MRLPGTLALLLLLSAPVLAQPVSAPHVTVELVPETTTITPGAPFRIGLRFELEHDWHTYWRNAGDAGLPPTLELSLPPGYTASDIAWPTPELFGEAPEMSYGYHGTVVLPVTITPPEGVKPGERIRIGGKATWLVCNDVCIPGKADLALTLEASTMAPEPSKWHGEFAATDLRMSKQPQSMAIGVSRLADHYEITVRNTGKRTAALPSSVHYFASEEGVIDHSAKQSSRINGDHLVITVPVSPYESTPPTHLRGILVASDSWNGGTLKAIDIDAPVIVERPAPAPEEASAGESN